MLVVQILSREAPPRAAIIRAATPRAATPREAPPQAAIIQAATPRAATPRAATTRVATTVVGFPFNHEDQCKLVSEVSQASAAEHLNTLQEAVITKLAPLAFTVKHNAAQLMFLVLLTSTAKHRTPSPTPLTTSARCIIPPQHLAYIASLP